MLWHNSYDDEWLQSQLQRAPQISALYEMYESRPEERENQFSFLLDEIGRLSNSPANRSDCRVIVAHRMARCLDAISEMEFDPLRFGDLKNYVLQEGGRWVEALASPLMLNETLRSSFANFLTSYRGASSHLFSDELAVEIGELAQLTSLSESKGLVKVNCTLRGAVNKDPKVYSFGSAGRIIDQAIGSE